jgi:heavy metal translocating P-type ATPase
MIVYMRMIGSFLYSPKREYLLIFLIPIAFVVDVIYPGQWFVLLTVTSFAAAPVVVQALRSLLNWNLSIDVFNTFALFVTFAVADIHSAAFIVLMLSFARLLEWRTETKTNNAVHDLLERRPKKAVRENETVISTIPIERIRKDDILIVKPGEPIPVDGVIVYGKTEVNEALVTGESLPQEKILGDEVLVSTINISQPIKIRATRIGKDSTLEKMAQLVAEAGKKKSKEQKFADVFAGYFFPIVLILGIGTYLATGNIYMTIALFLVACADDIAVAIPLAVTASLGHAAKRGVVVKGGSVLRELARTKTLVLDKTGTLTYGDFVLQDIHVEDSISKDDFWQAVAIAEKYSEHPIGKVLFRESVRRVLTIPNAQKYQVFGGAGVYAKYGKDDILIGTFDLLKEKGASFPRGFKKNIEEKFKQSSDTLVFVSINKIFVGYISITDMPRENARESLEHVRKLGVSRIVILSGDKEIPTMRVADEMNITEYYFALKPEEKLRHIERFAQDGKIIMVGDGINDAPALARADVGIAMGKGGSAIASEVADVIMLHDDLSELPHLIELGKRTSSVVYGDMGIWLATNVIGFGLVFVGMTPALAAFYNFATDFLPIFNSTRLFADRKVKDVL